MIDVASRIQRIKSSLREKFFFFREIRYENMFFVDEIFLQMIDSVAKELLLVDWFNRI